MCRSHCHKPPGAKPREEALHGMPFKENSTHYGLCFSFLCRHFLALLESTTTSCLLKLWVTRLLPVFPTSSSNETLTNTCVGRVCFFAAPPQNGVLVRGDRQILSMWFLR